MSSRPLTDAQISRALRAHLPARAQAGLRERVMDAVEATAQQRAFPLFLHGLSEADPGARRRSLLIAAALLVALAFASAAAVGALRLLQRDPVHELSLEPPADLPAFVLSSYERLLDLPPVALTWHDSDGANGRIYVDRSGAVRFDRFTSAEATEPSSYRILSGNRISGMALVESKGVWIEPGHEAIDDNPREYIRTVLSGGYPGPGCEMERDPTEVGSGTAAAGWRYVGAEYVAGRPTHHVACVGEHSLDTDLWLDIETRLILRMREPQTDDAGQSIPGQFGTTEVTEIAFGEQPAALFGRPEGLARMSAEEYSAYICTRDLPNELAPGITDCPSTEEPEATPPPTPLPTPRPSLGPRPSGPGGPLAWSPASLKEDWPAPVRSEPAGGSSVLPMPLIHMDPTGDTGSGVDPWVDIRGVAGGTGTVRLKLVSSDPPVVDPTDQWIAYGVVTDDDRDGVPDWRYGVDNGAKGEQHVWRTNLHTGRTDDKGFLAGYGSAWPDGDGPVFKFSASGDLAGGGTFTSGIALDMPFYTWASVIVNGRVVATDYAPDVGWLKATPGAKPGGTLLIEDEFGMDLSMTVPDGWTGQSFGTGGDEIGLDFNIAHVGYNEPPTWSCDAKGDEVEAHFGPTVEDLVAFLEGVETIKITENTEVTLGGYRGRYIEITPASTKECGVVPSFTQAWIVDVEGVRLAVGASVNNASETALAQLRKIVDSIQIEP
jgi:hypothetical protein